MIQDPNINGIGYVYNLSLRLNCVQENKNTKISD